MQERLSITIQNDLSEMERLSRVIAEFGEQHHLPSNIIFTMNLVLEEIVVNVISYGYDDHDEHAITIRLSLEDAIVTLEVEDDGRPFNPLDAPEVEVNKPLEERSVGGLGIHLVRHMMDELAYRHREGKNLLVMKKKIMEA